MPSLQIEGLQPAHDKLYAQPKPRNSGTHGKTKNTHRLARIARRIQKPSKPPKSAAIRNNNHDRVARSPPNLPKPVKLAWLEMQSRGFWLTSADRFLVEIAATLMARYRIEELKSGDVSLLIGLLGKIGFSPRERGRMNMPTK